MAIVGQSRAISAAVALLATLADSCVLFALAITDAFRRSSNKDARTVLNAVNQRLPRAMGASIMSLIASDARHTANFSGRQQAHFSPGVSGKGSFQQEIPPSIVRQPTDDRPRHSGTGRCGG